MTASRTTPIEAKPIDGTDHLIGATIDGRFDVEGPIRQGGMGKIYRALDRRSQTPVALKVLLHRRKLDAVAVQRFRSEAETMAALEHPNVVRVIEHGELVGGAPYMAMELLEGEDLDDFLVRRGTASPAELHDWLMPIAEALDDLHRQGLVHRDVKPANIFRHVEGDRSVVKLLDFGLARRIASARATALGNAVGTPHYTAPELVEGSPGGPRADVYSLASVAYELLAGQPPFDERRAVSVLMAKVSRRAPRLSSRLGDRVSRELDAVFASALSRDPDLRPVTCVRLIEYVSAAAERGFRASADVGSGPASGVRSTPRDSRPPSGVVPAEVARVLYLCAHPDKRRARMRESLGLSELELIGASTLVEARSRLREGAVRALICDLGEATDVALPFLEALRRDGLPSVVMLADASPEQADALGSSLVSLPASLTTALKALGVGLPTSMSKT